MTWVVPVSRRCRSHAGVAQGGHAGARGHGQGDAEPPVRLHHAARFIFFTAVEPPQGVQVESADPRAADVGWVHDEAQADDAGRLGPLPL